MKQPDFLCLYHRVNTILWYDVARMLQRIVLAVVENPGRPDVSFLDLNNAESVLEFIDQMECAYVHPRRNSAKRYLSSYRRSASHPTTANP